MKRFFTFTVFISLFIQLALANGIPPIQRVLPPKGIEVKSEDLKPYIEKLNQLQEQAKAFQAHPLYPDIQVFFKSVDLLIEHREFYKKNKLKDITKMLNYGKERLEQLKDGNTPWRDRRGLLVRGFQSDVDQSIQPYGLEIPEDLNLDNKVPLVVWLHGRGDKVTDYYFIQRRLSKANQFKFPQAITLHPFGRQCIGYKHVGEIDVFEAIEHVKSQYNIDHDQIALMGFSMGGAGTYHIGAHYTDQFSVIHTGAGFVETAKYNRLTPETYPPKYEQTLWQMYDVPNYARNFYNTPILAYCGEEDSKIPWVQLMQDAFKQQGQNLPVIVGKKIGHKYTPESLIEIGDFVSKALEKGNNHYPKTVKLQTPTLKYAKNYWVKATGLNQHWKESRIDATKQNSNAIQLKTSNIKSFELTQPWEQKAFHKNDVIEIDQQKIKLSKASKKLHFVKNNGTWSQSSAPKGLAKRPQQQGPMDDAYMKKFIVVTPDKECSNSQQQAWFDFELKRLRQRWKALYRGTLPECKASELKQEHIKDYNLILWGTPETNQWIAKTINNTPLNWTNSKVTMGSKSFDSAHHIPALIYPNPLNQNNTYLLYNSAPTFREGHDRTNSLQNPKLGDWAVFDIRQHPDKYSAGKIAQTDFFDESWKVK